MNNYEKISVVIPTLGGHCLNDTIKKLNSGTFIPDEILLCIPEEDSNKLVTNNFNNVKILKTSFRGQVAQRAYGFRLAKNELVLQLDDDIHLNYDCLETLVKFISKYPSCSVGPIFIDRNTNLQHSYLYKEKNQMSIFDKISFYILNGKDGCIAASFSKAGIFMGLPLTNDNFFDAGWLPGGCILHHKDNLIFNNYYPVSGKAYWEDLFLADLLHEKGILLHRVGKAVCTVDFSANNDMNFFFFVKEFISVFKIANLYVKKNKFSGTRISLFIIFNSLTLVWNKFTANIKLKF
jgi:hypothetical protein